MKERKKEKVKRVALIITLSLLVTLIVTTSYALFTNSFEGGKTSSIDTNDLKFNYNETSDSITLTDATSYTDAEGLTNGGTFTFDVSASSTKEQIVYYTIYLIEESTNTMDSSYVKLALLDDSNNTLVSTTSYKKLFNFAKKENAKTLYRNEINLPTQNDVKQNYVLKYWVDSKIEELTTTTEENKQTVSLNGGEFKFKVNVMRTEKPLTGPETLIKKVGTGGLVADSHRAATQTQAQTAYRYTGANPDNYVSFNNELWRIIGVFDVDDGTGTLEQRIKLIRNESIGKIAWDSNDTNDWPKSSGMKLLNSGAYWNRTGSYASTGLTAEAKTMIENAKWYLGGTEDPNLTTGASGFYGFERGTTVYTGRPTSWVGKVALMYPSDYGYATSGGSTTNRASCLTKAICNWDGVSDCTSNDWLYLKSNEWTITPYPGSKDSVYIVLPMGNVKRGHSVTSTLAFRPTVYLSSNVLISGGTGTETDPYQLSL